MRIDEIQVDPDSESSEHSIAVLYNDAGEEKVHEAECVGNPVSCPALVGLAVRRLKTTKQLHWKIYHDSLFGFYLASQIMPSQCYQALEAIAPSEPRLHWRLRLTLIDAKGNPLGRPFQVEVLGIAVGQNHSTCQPVDGTVIWTFAAV